MDVSLGLQVHHPLKKGTGTEVGCNYRGKMWMLNQVVVCKGTEEFNVIEKVPLLSFL